MSPGTWHPGSVRLTSSILGRAAALGALTALVAGCATGPSLRPELALSGHQQGVDAAPTEEPEQDEPAEEPLPPIPVPAEEPNWASCTDGTLDLPTGSGAPQIECATLFGPLDVDGGPGTMRIELLRAVAGEADEEAGPVVLTAGADTSSRQAAIDLAAGDQAPDRPVVAVERRGMGPATAPDCLTDAERRGLTAAGADGADPAARAEKMGNIVNGATVACTDMLRPALTSHDARHAAADIAVLKDTWQVDQVAILALGSGVDVALAYAAADPDGLARLVLDSPTPVGVSAADIERGRARAAESALDALAAWCPGADCALGPDAAGRLTALFDRADSGGLGPVTVGALRTTIETHLTGLGADFDTRARAVTDLLAAAADGDDGARETIAAATVLGDGRFTAVCSDAPGGATQADVIAEYDQWAEQYPRVGADAALRMLQCAAWPSQDRPVGADRIEVPVLVLTGAADPVAGAGALDPVLGALQRAGASTLTVNWAGTGHGAGWQSDCAAGEIADYLDTGLIPMISPSCPA